MYHFIVYVYIWYDMEYDMIWCGINMMYEKYRSCIDRTWPWCDLMIWFYAHLLYIYIYYDMIWYNVIWYDVIYCDLINYDLYNGVLWFNGIIYIYIWQWTIVTSLICTNLNLMCIYICMVTPPHDLPSMSSSMIHLQS